MSEYQNRPDGNSHPGGFYLILSFTTYWNVDPS